MPKASSRRDFLTKSAVTGAVAGAAEGQAIAAPAALKTANTTKTLSICPYCAVGCSLTIHTIGDKAKNVKPAIVHIEGDPDSPVNRGTLCSKGASLIEFVQSDRRLNKIRYRAAGGTEWKDLSWAEAIPMMAARIKATRDAGFEEKDEQGRTVNRLTNMAMIGGCTDTNEINYLISKFRLSLGLLAYENQSRL